MTILCRVKTGRTDLFVCGTPSAEWLEWVRTTTVPLCDSQLLWRRIAEDRAGTADPVQARARTAAARSSPSAPRRPRAFRASDTCDQCKLPEASCEH